MGSGRVSEVGGERNSLQVRICLLSLDVLKASKSLCPSPLKYLYFFTFPIESYRYKALYLLRGKMSVTPLRAHTYPHSPSMYIYTYIYYIAADGIIRL